MKRLLLMAAVVLMTAMSAMAQKQPAGMRVEVAESETDNGEYSIFTYKDSEAAPICRNQHSRNFVPTSK